MKRLGSMRMGRCLATVALAAVAVLTPTMARATIVPAATFTGGSPQYFPNYTVGWTFTATQSLSINSFGWYDEGNDGLLSDHAIGIWNLADPYHEPFASTTVTAGTTDVLDGGYRYHNLSQTLTLGPGSYVIAGTSGQDTFQAFADTVTTAPGITYGQGRFIWGPALTYPSGPADRAISYFGPNFSTTVPTPEPSTYAMMGLGAMAMLMMARRRKQETGDFTLR